MSQGSQLKVVVRLQARSDTVLVNAWVDYAYDVIVLIRYVSKIDGRGRGCKSTHPFLGDCRFVNRNIVSKTRESDREEEMANRVLFMIVSATCHQLFLNCCRFAYLCISYSYLLTLLPVFLRLLAPVWDWLGLVRGRLGTGD